MDSTQESLLKIYLKNIDHPIDYLLHLKCSPKLVHFRQVEYQILYHQAENTRKINEKNGKRDKI